MTSGRLSTADRGVAIYLTGGTTAGPRQVQYDRRRWRRSVAIKAEMMRAHGVGPNSRIAVCHPFDPWSIGGIHRDAALACGAHVLPLGLSAGTPAMLSVLAGFGPDFICGTSSLVALWLQDVAMPRGPITLLHAGEPLRPDDREACERRLGRPIVNIYGLAELDAVGCELESGSGFLLTPDFTYRLIDRDGVPVSLDQGASGALQVRESRCADWVSTNDHVVVLGFAPPQSRLWPGAATVAHVHRLDHAVDLPDGSAISAAQVRAAEGALAGDGVAALQVQVSRPSGRRAEVALVAVRRDGHEPRAELVRSRMLAVACDLADAEASGAVSIIVRVTDGEKVLRTQRGKFSSVVLVDAVGPAAAVPVPPIWCETPHG